VIFKDRFTWVLDAHYILDHIDGIGEEPKDPISSEIRAKVSMTPLTEEQKKLKVELGNSTGSETRRGHG
jgi:hypothetical protein